MMLSTLLLALIASQSYAATLTVTVQGTGAVSSIPVGISNCGSNNSGTCSADFTPDKGKTVSVQLTATGQVPSWGGDVPTTCATNSTCSIEIAGVNKNVTVTFSAAATPVINVPSATPIAITQVSSQDTIAFGEQSAKTTTTLTVSNTVVNSTLQNISVAINGTGFSKTTTDTCSGQSVNNCTVEIAFNPTNLTSPATGSITISATGATTKIINLSGSKKVVSQPVISPSSNSISIIDGQSGTVTIKNSSTGELKDIAASLVDSNKGFTISNNGCTGQILTGNTASCDITVNFSKPTGVTTDQTTTLKLTTATDTTGVGVTLTGKVIAAPAKLNVSPTSLSAFAETEIGQTSTEQTVTISNAGDAELTNLTIGEVPAGFTKLTTCGTTLAKAGICTVAVKFAPQTGQTGTISGDLKITSSDNATGFSIKLSGTVKTAPPPCSSANLSACTKDDCATIGGGTWNTTANPNRCDKVVQKVTLTVIPPTNGKLFCDGVDCVNGKQYDSGTTIAIQGVANPDYSPSAWTNDAAICGINNPCQFKMDGNKTIGANFEKVILPKLTLKVNAPVNGKLLCDGVDCMSLNGKQYDVEIVMKVEAVPDPGYSFSRWTDNAIGAGCLPYNPCSLSMVVTGTNTNHEMVIGAIFTIADCPRDTEKVNDSCIATSLMRLKLDPVFEINPALGQTSISSSVFLGGVGTSISDLTSSGFLTDNQTLKFGETVSISGVILPKAEDVGKMVDILVVGLYLPNEELSKVSDACDPNNGGNYYVNIRAEDIYCFWIADGHNISECNGTEANPTNAQVMNRRSATKEDYWQKWNGKLDQTGLPAIARGVLTNPTNLTGLYTDKLNYTGHVCINFGYRLENGTIVFNGNPIKYRVSP